MMYKDDKGRCFIGKPYNYVENEIIILEASNIPLEYGCYRIIKFLETVSEKK